MPAKKPTKPQPEEVSLALLAILLAGGDLESTSALARLVKRPLDHAVKEGLVQQQSEARKTQDASGKIRRKTIKRFVLDDAGREHVRALRDPDLHAVTSALVAQHVQASLGSAIDHLRNDVVRQIDVAATTLARELRGWTPAGHGAHTHDSAKQDAPSLRDQLASAYRALCRRVEYEDGMVDIPRLYRWLRQDIPGLSVEGLRDELQRLWTSQDLELRVLNEVDTLPADQRAFGVPYANALYFYVFWPREQP